MENNNQKAIGFLFILFLTMTYKEMVWDPYFLGPNGLQNQGTVAPSTDVTSPTVASPSIPLAVPTQQQFANLTPAPKKLEIPTDAQVIEKGLVTLENSAVQIQISKLGGRIVEYRLKNYRDNIEKTSLPLNLVDHTDSSPLPLGVYSGAESDTWVEYESVEADSSEVKLAGALSDGRKISKKIRLSENEYLASVSVTLSAPPADGSRLQLEWSRLIPPDSPNFLDSQSTGGFVWFDGQRAHRETYNAMKTERENFGKVRWVSTTDHYFVTSLIALDGESDASSFHNGELFRIRLAGESTSGNFLLLGGPKSYRILERLGLNLERNIDFGWSGFLSAPLLALLHLFYGVFKNYGLAIVALTILVRMLLLPLNAASFKSMQKMQELQPELQRIKESIKDKQQQQIAQMELFKKKGVNPLGGCLPILIQMPIFLGLYSALLLAIELRHAPFALWVKDLSVPEYLSFGAFHVPVLVVLFVVSMLYQQWSTPSTMDETQKKIMLVMPIIFGFLFFIHMPAGLTLYWLTSNIISIAQMQQLRKPGKHSAFLVTSGVAVLTLAFAWALTAISGT